MRLESFHTLYLALFALDLPQFDVSTAYLHARLLERSTLEARNLVWLLYNGLYALKHAGRIWCEWLKADMEALEYLQCPRDPAVFQIGTWKREDREVCAFRVDDDGSGLLLPAGSLCELSRQKRGISGVKHNDVALSQESYIDSLVVRFGLESAHKVTTSLTSVAILTKHQCAKTLEEIQDMASNNYRELMGSIHYLALAT
jgi:hypothetical protein